MVDRRALVVYGSETGNAQEGAEELARLATRLRFLTELLPLSYVEPRNFCDYDVVLCALSTTGQGEPPANAKHFWKKLLRKKLPVNYLASCCYAMFGYGDSSYPKYNFASLRMNRRLKQLGAQEIISIGQGDEQYREGHDSTFVSWTVKLRIQLLELFPLGAGAQPIPDTVLLEPEWLLASIDKDDEPVAKAQLGAAWSGSGANDPRDIEVILQDNKRVTPKDHWQDVRHLTFSSSQTSYSPGDVLIVYPRNPGEDVDQVINLMRWNHIADQPLKFSRNLCCSAFLSSAPPSLEAPVDKDLLTLRNLLQKHFDLNAIPKRSIFNLLAHFTGDDFQKNRLLEFTNPVYLDELYDYTTRPRRSILEVLQEFDTVKIPWQWAMTVFPQMRGRQFSIASGGKLTSGPGHSTRFELLVAIVKYKTVIRKVRRGVCTRYLESLRPGTSLLVTLQRGCLNITAADATRPFIMVGPGTGVAPLRSLIWQRLSWNNQLRQKAADDAFPSLVPGDNILFFGCRNKDADYFFQDEWAELKDQMPLQVLPSFSRDEGQRQYVQDSIHANSKMVSRILYEERGLVFVCGSSGKMPRAVQEALMKTLETEGQMDQEASRAYIAQMEKANRYIQETW